jgi:exopolyphosphatase/guanosine-5'-triphosphate,3'-diphosphate pyrophosphatase
MTSQAPARAPHDAAEPGGRLGVIDIGSNSVRLVVFDGLSRQPIPVLNERVMCGLGRELSSTGRLDEAGAALAQATVSRFARLAEVMKLGRLEVVATAAVREAADGPEFVAELGRRSGLEVRVLSGVEEARLAALGVISAAPGADGVMGDLGGGSLELVALERGEPGAQATLPLGQLRLRELAEAAPGPLPAAIDEQLAAAPWLGEVEDRTLYAVGGGWRALARADMALTGYPLRVIHGHRLSRQRALELAETVAGLDRRSLAQLPGVRRKRLDALPYAALTLSRLLQATRPREVMFSAHGLREGWLYDQLDAAVRRRDPLIEGCRDLAAREGRFSEHGDELYRWTTPLFPDEAEEDRRLRLAASVLSEVAWRGHPDRRADEAMLTVLWAPFVAIDHPGRAFVALAVRARYSGGGDSEAVAATTKLAGPEAARRAAHLGLALRLGHTITGGAPDLLDDMSLSLEERGLVLAVSSRNQVLIGEAVRKRLDALAAALGRAAIVEVSS